MRLLQRSVLGALFVTAGALVACQERPDQYVGEGDTGAAAPATKLDPSATPQRPDSTTGVSKPVMRGATAGDTVAREKSTESSPTPPPDSQKPE